MVRSWLGHGSVMVGSCASVIVRLWLNHGWVMVGSWLGSWLGLG